MSTGTFVCLSLDLHQHWRTRAAGAGTSTGTGTCLVCHSLVCHTMRQLQRRACSVHGQICTFTHAYLHTCTMAYTHMPTFMPACTRAHTHMYTHRHKHIHAHACLQACVPAHPAGRHRAGGAGNSAVRTHGGPACHAQPGVRAGGLLLWRCPVWAVEQFLSFLVVCLALACRPCLGK